MPSRPLLTEPNLRRSHSGPAASEVFCGAPRVPSSHWCLHSSGLLFWNGYGSHLDVTDATCTCGGRLDSLGRHRGDQGSGPSRWLFQASVCGTGHSWQWMLHCAVPQHLVVQLAPTQCCCEFAETFSELVDGARCHLVVVAIENGRRWSDGRDAPQALQRPAFLAWRRRWTRMLAVSCCRAFSSSLISAGVV